MKILISPAIGQLIRYGIVGVMSNCLIYCGYLFIVYLGGGAKFSMTLMYLTGVVFSFFANFKWTFSQEDNRGTLFRYLQLHLVGYLLNFLLLFTFVDFLHYPHQVVQAISIVLVAIFGFFVCKYYVFQGGSK